MVAKPEIIDQTSDFIVCVKPAGWLSVPSRLGRNDQRLCLGYELEQILSRPVFPVHRLDLEVSGLILFALSAEGHREASLWFEHRNIKKTYSALTPRGDGEIPTSEQTWKSVLLRGKKRAYPSPHGKDCLTLAQVASCHTDHLGWILNPITGRPHQLRFELSHRGFPIVGDALYGSTLTWSEPGIALKCIGLDFAGCSKALEFGLKEHYQLAPLSLQKGS